MKTFELIIQAETALTAAQSMLCYRWRDQAKELIVQADKFIEEAQRSMERVYEYQIYEPLVRATRERLDLLRLRFVIESLF